MIAADEAALECDLAETYHIFDYRALNPSRVALFSIGLRDDSRIKLKLNNQKCSNELILIAAAVDRLSYLLWLQSKDGHNGVNRPQSIVEQLTKIEQPKEYEVFESPEDFENALKKIRERGIKKCQKEQE